MSSVIILFLAVSVFILDMFIISYDNVDIHIHA